MICYQYRADRARSALRGIDEQVAKAAKAVEAHPTIVFATLAVSRWIDVRTGWSIRKFVTTARRYRTVEIQAGHQTITAADPLSDDLHPALEAITRAKRAAR